jgi:D-ribose pyranase
MCGAMITDGILNPALLAMLARFRHTNTIVIADRGFPFWREIPTVDISLVDDVPTVRQVLAALRGRYVVGAAWMAREFKGHNDRSVAAEYAALLDPAKIRFEPHSTAFKPRVPAAIGLIRTGDTTPYGNIILESA